MARRGDFIWTYSGIKFYPLSPRAEDVNIEDIAHALSNICRFTGHCKEFYSVAQHSVLVADECSEENSLWGLLHDASEAYLCDVPRPLKRLEGFEEFYLEAEARVMRAVCRKFGLPPRMPKEVHRNDSVILCVEQLALMPQSGPPWHDHVLPMWAEDWPLMGLGPAEAKAAFLRVYRSLVD